MLAKAITTLGLDSLYAAELQTRFMLRKKRLFAPVGQRRNSRHQLVEAALCITCKHLLCTQMQGML